MLAQGNASVPHSTLAEASQSSCSATRLTAFRDVGVSVNQSARCPLLKEGVLYAYDAEMPPKSDECARTRKDRGLASIISTTGKKLPAPEPGIVGVLSPNERGITAEELASFTYHSTSLRSKKYAKKLMGRFSLRTHWKLLTGIMSMDLHNSNLEALVTDVMYARGPINETIDVLETAPERVGAIFNTILSDPRNYPLMICGQELLRDQNLLLLFILLLLEVPIEHIVGDYLCSVSKMPRFLTRNEQQARFEEQVLSEGHEWVMAVCRYLDQRHGGAKAYLTRAGVPGQAIDALRKVLQAGSAKDDTLAA